MGEAPAGGHSAPQRPGLRRRSATWSESLTRLVRRGEASSSRRMRRQAEEAEAEERMEALAEAGLHADVLLAYSTAGGGTSRVAEAPAAPVGTRVLRRVEAREHAIEAMQAVGLRVIRSESRDGRMMLLKITAPLSLLEHEAERVGMDMLLRNECRPQLASANNPKRADRPYYADFKMRNRDDFALKRGRLFSSLERQRLIFSILEATKARGGAELNVDYLVERGIFCACLSLHDEAERELLYESWRMIRVWPCGNGGTLRRIIPDLGLNQQPLDGIRDYYGEKIAFYFGWLDEYTSWLWLLMWVTLSLEVLSLADGCELLGSVRITLEADNCEDGTEVDQWSRELCSRTAAATLPINGVLIALWATFRQVMWKRRQNGLLHSLHYMHRTVCTPRLGPHLSRLVHSEHVPLAVLAYEWDVLDFEQDEAPRIEFVQAFSKGIWRDGGKRPAMRMDRGFYRRGRGRVRRFVSHPEGEEVLVMSSWQRLKAYMVGVPMLLFLVALTVAVMISIFSFRMLMRLATQYENNTYFNYDYGSFIGAVLNTLWISIMNVAYQRVAVLINNLENHRTETEHEDALIIKTFLFQFINSYGPLFYLSFFKPYSLALFDSWGLRDPYGNPYVDMCGKRGRDWWALVNCSFSPGDGDGCPVEARQYDCEGRSHIFVREDCWGDVRVQMICFTLLKPLYELPIQLLLPRVMRWVRMWRRERTMRHQFKAAMVPSTELVGAASAAVGRAATMVSQAADNASLGGGTSTAAPVGTTRLTETSRALESEKELAYFSEKLEHQIALESFRGTIYEYNSKVVQFGYLALFSSTFPLSSCIAAAVNFFELRVDATKIGYETRRPRYLGARDVGSWQTMMSIIAWMAILVNVLLLFTSWTFRDELVVPWLIASAKGAECASTNVLEDMTPLGVWDGTNTSWYDDSCADNYKLCFQEIGSAPWLSASKYLDDFAFVSRPLYDVMCEVGSAHYNARLCALCGERRLRANYTMGFVLVVLEHVIIVTKLFLDVFISDRPSWLARAEACDNFVAQLAKQQRQDAAQPEPPSRPEVQARLTHAAQVMDDMVRRSNADHSCGDINGGLEARAHDHSDHDGDAETADVPPTTVGSTGALNGCSVTNQSQAVTVAHRAFHYAAPAARTLYPRVTNGGVSISTADTEQYV